MRTRRNLAVLAVSLAAHLALLAAWLSTRPQLRFADPPAMAVLLVRPPPEPKTRPPPPPRLTTIRPRPARPVAPPPSELPLPPAPAAARPPTDEELLAGPRPTAAQLRAGRDRTILFQGWPRGCKPASDHSNRPGPPCRVGGPDDQASLALGDKDPGGSGFAAEGRRKDAIKDYKDGPGVGGAYPGIRCTIFHRC